MGRYSEKSHDIPQEIKIKIKFKITELSCIGILGTFNDTFLYLSPEHIQISSAYYLVLPAQSVIICD